MPNNRSLVTRIHTFLNQPKVELLLLFLILVIILRIPNFAEPYWYGDEGIYLTLGNALRQGARLYVDIVDHKTPLIYYLAMVPSQFSFRLLLLGWMLAATTFFYIVAWKWLKNIWAVTVASLTFVLLTTLPALEGNIPNGELFVMGFVLAGAALLASSQFLMEKAALAKSKDLLLVLLSGIFFGLGILTKVPAIFDLAAFMALGWFSFSHALFTQSTQNWLSLLRRWSGYELSLIIGAALAVLVSVLYFVARGSGQAYLDFGLLYNFRYAGSWSLPFSQPWLVFSFSLLGKVLVTMVAGLALTISTKWLKPIWPTVIMWIILALFASTLSNRPYPHYFMQIVPPLALGVGYLAKIMVHFIASKQRNVSLSALQLGGTIISLVLVMGVWRLLQFNRYPTMSYYSNFFKLMTGQISSTAYADSFNSLLAENREVTRILRQHPDRYLLIWGTNPMLYATSGKQPVGRFTVSFHIKDFDAYGETLTALKEKHPYYVVVMRDEQNSFPELNEYLSQNYTPNLSFEHMTVWKLQ